MRRFKVLIGMLFMVMAMGELASCFIAYPAMMVFMDTRTEWWAAYLPFLLFINALACSILLMFCGVKMMGSGSLITEKQSKDFFAWVKKQLEKKKYGYDRSLYIIIQKEVK